MEERNEVAKKILKADGDAQVHLKTMADELNGLYERAKTELDGTNSKYSG